MNFLKGTKLSTELALTTEATFDQIAKITGQTDTGTKSFLPRLKLNKDFETEDGKQIPPGTYALDLDTGTVYAKTAVFRPYINSFQYSVYDEATRKYPNKTIIFKSWSDEAIDEKGTVRCGKVTGKAKDKLTEAQVALQKDIKCYRNLYGTVTMTGVTADAQTVTVTEEPCLMRVTGSAFTPIGDALQPLTKGQRPFFTATIDLLAPTREKKGATIYYVPVAKPNLAAQPKPISMEDMELLQKFQDTIDFENKPVIEKYQKAHAFTVQTDHIMDDIEDAGYIDMSDDMNQPLPDSMR